MRRRIVSVLCIVSLLSLSACGKEAETEAIEEKVPAVSQEEQEKPQEAPAEEEAPQEKTFQELFQIEAENIDYLSVEGIEAPEGAVLAVVGKDSGSGFWKQVRKGMEEAVTDLNAALGYTGNAKVTLTYDAPDGEDVAEQIDIIDQMLDKNPDALCIGFIDVNSGSTQLELANANGIPVLAVDSGIENSLIVNTSSTDNYQAGAEAARQAAKAIGDAGKIALLVHNSVSETGIQREKGFVEELERNHPEIEVVNISYREQDERSVDEIVAAVLAEHPDLDLYFATNDQTTKELTDALALCLTEEQQVYAAGFDASASQMAEIEEGILLGVMSQNPFAMGYASAVASFRAMAGMENAKSVETGYTWISMENLTDERIPYLTYK